MLMILLLCTSAASYLQWELADKHDYFMQVVFIWHQQQLQIFGTSELLLPVPICSTPQFPTALPW